MEMSWTVEFLVTGFSLRKFELEFLHLKTRKLKLAATTAKYKIIEIKYCRDRFSTRLKKQAIRV